MSAASPCAQPPDPNALNTNGSRPERCAHQTSRTMGTHEKMQGKAKRASSVMEIP